MQNLRMFLFALIFVNTGLSAAPLSGPYTINSSQPTGGTNFQTFTAFADSINLNGVSGNVTVSVVPGTGPYNEKVLIENVQGTSASATVTIDGSNETITFLTDSANRAVFRMRNLTYFTVTNLHVARDPAAVSGFMGIHIYESGDHITVTNCVIDMSGSSSTLIGGIIASGSTTSILTEGNFNNIEFSHDTCIGGGYGSSLFGLPTLSRGIVITDNTFYDFHSNGVYIRETDSVVIARNYFDKRTSNVTTVNAIQLAQSANINGQIYDNHIKVSQVTNGTQTFRGIYLFNGTGHRVYNNVISEINLESGNVTAIEVRTGATAPEIYFNTISIDKQNSSTGELFGIKESLNNTGTKLLNNMISITQPTTGVKAAIGLSSGSTVTSAIISDYNNFWVPSGSVAIKEVVSGTPVSYATLNDWTTASSQDSNSSSFDPLFTSFSQSIPTNSLVDGTGIAVNYITTDILGNARAVTPDMGAYEFIITSVSQLSGKENSLAVYPNPANDYFVVETGSDTYRMEIFNAVGEKVYSKIVNGGSAPAIISAENFNSGAYYITVKTEAETLHGKIIKQ